MNKLEITKLALELSPEERAEVANTLLQSIERPSQEEIERRWAAVIERRAEELRSGKVKGIPADEVSKKLRAIVESDLSS